MTDETRAALRSIKEDFEMAFICDFCKQPQNAGVSPDRVVTERRRKEYPHGGGMSLGHEIVTEKSACSPCAQEVRDKQTDSV